MFGFIKTTINEQIVIDHCPMNFDRKDPDYKKLIPDFVKDYPDAKEKMDPGIPELFGPSLETTILVDLDHAHNHKTRRSLTGLLAFVGSTPVMWLSKRQGSVASSTYAAEFSALLTVTEEAQSLRYMLRCLGCNIPSDGSCPTKIFGDNLSMIQNAQNPAADLSKKHPVRLENMLERLNILQIQVPIVSQKIIRLKIPLIHRDFCVATGERSSSYKSTARWLGIQMAFRVVTSSKSSTLASTISGMI